MLYRPNFCCNCGEKIERAVWPLLASRRFCDLCETEHTAREWARRGLVVIALIIGAAGFFRYIGPTASPDRASIKTIGTMDIAPAAPNFGSNLNATPQQPSQSQPGTNTKISQNTVETSDEMPKARPVSKDTEPVYYCGAMTKKGT